MARHTPATRCAHITAADGRADVARSGVKPTTNPSVMICMEPPRYGFSGLPADEHVKAFRVLVSVFTVADTRCRDVLQGHLRTLMAQPDPNAGRNGAAVTTTPAPTRTAARSSHQPPHANAVTRRQPTTTTTPPIHRRSDTAAHQLNQLPIHQPPPSTVTGPGGRRRPTAPGRGPGWWVLAGGAGAWCYVTAVRPAPCRPGAAGRVSSGPRG
ncbi:DUF5958 family protein [Streptomyces sp. NPDC127110]|uniref:DUF5958 family protein n=1 Tax=Streptomyces sp. NPDC127110 TaxID=3345362 RepID=UPI0036311F1C